LSKFHYKGNFNIHKQDSRISAWSRERPHAIEKNFLQTIIKGVSLSLLTAYDGHPRGIFGFRERAQVEKQ
jgi:hypothetical protein